MGLLEEGRQRDTNSESLGGSKGLWMIFNVIASNQIMVMYLVKKNCFLLFLC